MFKVTKTSYYQIPIESKTARFLNLSSNLNRERERERGGGEGERENLIGG
jgi:hypothetical protein